MLQRVLIVLLGIALLSAVVFAAVWWIGRRGTSPETSPPARGSASDVPLIGGRPTGGSDDLFIGKPPSGETLRPISGQAGLSVEADPSQWTTLEDTDGDGLPNQLEEKYGTNEHTPDTDGDGFNDGDEVLNGYDPRQPGSKRLDSDKDGLLENEEFRWKTDPFNPDTDGDGFKDGDEVQNGFDPTVPSDGQGNDALPARKGQEAENALNALRPNPNSTNYTEGLAGVFLGNRPLGEASRVKITPEEVTRVLNAAKINTTLPKVAITDITVSKTNTKNDLRDYLTAADSIRPAHLTDGAQLTNALLRAFSGQSSDLARIRAGITQYEQSLLKLSAPASAVDYHELLISIVQFLNNRLGVIEQVGATDPARAYLAAREVQEVLGAQAPRLRDLRTTIEGLAR